MILAILLVLIFTDAIVPVSVSCCNPTPIMSRLGNIIVIHILFVSKLVTLSLSLSLSPLSLSPPHAALGLAIARDGSSGGVIRLAIIEEGGVTRSVFTGPEIPQFYDK